MVLPDISHCLNLTLDIFNMKISEKCQGFNSHSDLSRPDVSGLHKSHAR